MSAVISSKSFPMNLFKAKIRAGVKRILLDSEFSPESFEKLVPVIMVQAENNYSEYV